ncbi:hypothetical protein KIN20_034496 [Parelaphostrongylus tenuis]|uniref:Uncharacterized protein n=1 Tax=Parelaphostrongylus tenuis TaxID=148309 RepID=A0AAD5R9R1_PARTN|nr:hypothetical protein KIN20_034496 [Parelaphostrongylus tenuis]
MCRVYAKDLDLAHTTTQARTAAIPQSMDRRDFRIDPRNLAPSLISSCCLDGHISRHIGGGGVWNPNESHTAPFFTFRHHICHICADLSTLGNQFVYSRPTFTKVSELLE